MEDIKLIYPTYEDIISINYFNKNIINKNNKGKFIIDKNILKIRWNNKIHNEDIFIKTENIDDINFNSELDNISIFIYIKDNKDTVDSFIEIKNQYESLYSVERLHGKIIPKFCSINNANENINIILINNKVVDYISLNELGNCKITDKLLITWNNLIEETYIINTNNSQYYIFEEFKINEIESNIFEELEINNSEENTEKYNVQIFINHINWNGLCTINNDNEYFYRNDDNNEYGKFIIKNDILTVYWDKWSSEEFKKYSNTDYDLLDCYIFIDSEKCNINSEDCNIDSEECNIDSENYQIDSEECNINSEECNIYSEDCNINSEECNIDSENYQIDSEDCNIDSENCNIETDDFKLNLETNIKTEKIYIIHINWTDNCIINLLDKKIYRESNEEDIGDYLIENNKLTVNWKNWDSEIFYGINNIYYYEKDIKFISFLNNDCNNIFNKNYSIKDNIDISIINFFTNKIYTNNKGSYNFYFDSNYIFIDDNDNDFKKYYYVYDIEQNIIVYKSSYIEINIIKDENEKIILNLLNNTFNVPDKEYGTYKIDLNKNIIELKFSNDELFYNYTYKDNNYYYTEYLLDDREVIFIDNNKNSLITYNIYKIDVFENILFKDNIKYKYLKNNNNFCILVNNIFIEYYFSEYLNNNNTINRTSVYISKNIYNKIKDLNFNYKIYTELNDISNTTKLEIYINWLNYGLNNYKIYSIDSFLYYHPFFNIDGYMKNNYFKNEVESIIHWSKYGIFSNYFYSDINIEIVYDNFEENNQEDIDVFGLDNSDLDTPIGYLFSDNNFETVYKFEDNNHIESLLYIINIDCYNDINIENILESIPKKINCIININFCEYTDITYNLYELLNKSFNNVIVIKSKNIVKYYLLEFINKNILDLKNISYENIIYIDLKQNKFSNINILTNLQSLNNDNIILINNNKIYKNYTKNNLFYYLLNFIKKIKEKENIIYCINNLEIIKILVFYCIIRKKVFELGEKDFIITYNLFRKVISNDFGENINFLV